MSFSLRLATLDDIPAALQLCRLSGWNQLERDWRRLLEYEPQGCFAAEREGVLVGTVTTTRYDTDMAWIGMMLVHPDCRRQGIATELMKRSLDYLRDAGVRCIKLDATPEGRYVYEQLGFQPEWAMRRWRRMGSGPSAAVAAGSSSRFDPTDLQPFLEIDRRAFGVDRQPWLLRLLPESEVRSRAGAIGMLRPGFLASYLGPLIASDLGAAKLVVEELIQCTAAPVFWDIPEPNDAAVALAQDLQFEPVRDLTRMWLGSHHVESDLGSLFALADPSTG